MPPLHIFYGGFLKKHVRVDVLMVTGSLAGYIKVKVKADVKFILEQAMKAQTESRGINLLFLQARH
jgi:hypothetical protein